MPIKPFRASVIKKASRYKVFKSLKHRDELAREAGDRGFSNSQMEKKLKEMGYDPKRRKAVINHILGGGRGKGGRLSMEEISALSKEDIAKLPWEERVRVRKIKEVRKQRNINRGIYERQLEEQAAAKTRGGNDIAIRSAKGMASRQARLGLAGRPGAIAGADSGSGPGLNKTGSVFAGGLNKKPTAPPPPNSPVSSGPTIPLAKP